MVALKKSLTLWARLDVVFFWRGREGGANLADASQTRCFVLFIIKDLSLDLRGAYF